MQVLSLYLHLTEFLRQGHLCHIWRRLLRPNIVYIIFCPIQVLRAREGHESGPQIVRFCGCGENLMWEIIIDYLFISTTVFKEQTTQKTNTTHLNISSPLESQREFCLTQRPPVFCRHSRLQKFSPNVCWTFQGIVCQIPAERFASLKTNSGIWKVFHFNLKA